MTRERILPDEMELKMKGSSDSVRAMIHQAFKGVILGDGIGLWEGQAIDDYAGEDTEKAYRERDEKKDWSAISVDDLNRCNSSLSFFDAEGMRFHLPAYLIATLNGTLWEDPIFHLTHFDVISESRYSLLSDAQRLAVRAFLLLLKDDDSSEFERPFIEMALDEFWTDSQTRREEE